MAAEGEENNKPKDGEDDDELPTEFISADDNDAKKAKRDFQDQFGLQPAKIKSLEPDVANISGISTVGNYDRESRNIAELESIQKLIERGKYTNEARVALTAYARKNGYIIDFEYYQSDYSAIVDELKIRMAARQRRI